MNLLKQAVEVKVGVRSRTGGAPWLVEQQRALFPLQEQLEPKWWADPGVFASRCTFITASTTSSLPLWGLLKPVRWVSQLHLRGPPPLLGVARLLLLDVFSAPQDAAFNKTSRSLQELQQRDVGVKPEFRCAPCSWLLWRWKAPPTLTVVCLQRQPVRSQEGAEPPQPADLAAAQAAVSAPGGPGRHPEPHTHR